MTDLAAHFAYLAQTTGWEAVIASIFDRARGSMLIGDRLVVDFGKYKLVAFPPEYLDGDWPEPFRAVLKPHARLSFTKSEDGDGWGLHLAATSIEGNLLEGSELEEETSVR